MLKKVLAILLALALCLSLGACKKDDVQQPGNDDSSESIVNSGSSESNDNSESTGNSESVDNSESIGNSDSTGNTENAGSSENTETEKQLAVSNWQPEVPNYLSYEEYFSVQREFYNGSFYSPIQWIKGDKIFALKQTNDGWVVSCRENEEYYTIPNTKGYTEYTLLGADGQYAYMYYEACLIRMNLVTGEPERLLHYPIYDAVSFTLCDNLVLYYLVYVNNKLEIGRIYLPELKYDTLYQEQGEFYGLYLQRPKTNSEPIVWTLRNPEFITFLKGEFANPDSQFQKFPVNNGETIYAYSKYWENGGDISGILGESLLMHHMQETCGIPFSLKCIYNPATEDLSKKTGIIDNCSYGSGYPHDHYNTEVTTAPAPEVIMGQWHDPDSEIPFDLRPNDKTSVVKRDCVLITGVDSKEYLYVRTDGDYKQIVSSPVKMVLDTGACVLYVTDDGKALYAVSYDGTKTVELYRAVHGKINAGDAPIWNCLGYERKRALILDGDTMIEINLSNGQYRELVRHENLKFYYVDTEYKNGKDNETDTIYFDVYVGLYYEGYTLNTITGELKEGYRL